MTDRPLHRLSRARPEHARGMRGLRAASAAIACLGASACSFRSPHGSPDAPSESVDASVDAPPAVQACLNDPTYVADGTGRRYKYISQDADYDTAIDRCAADGAHLPVIDSMAENTYVRSLGTNDIWLGFNDLAEENTFRWTTGAPATFTRWAGGEPNDENTEDCTYLRSDGQWNDTACEEAKRPVCECDPAYHPPETPTCRTATTGFTLRHGRRFFARTAAKPWAEAKADCESIGAYLMVVVDDDENTDLNNLLTGSAWLGLSDRATEGTFRWVNGSPSTYSRWTGGTVPQDEALDCGVLLDAGTWSNVNCDTTSIYACECAPVSP
jgi:hypothetical protein